MSISRWEPFREFDEMSERMQRAFGRAVPTHALTTFDWVPAVDVAETPEEFQIKAELPEVKKEDLKVAVEHGVLRIEGERKQEKEEKNKKFHRVERSYGSFLRTFTLPDNVDGTRVAAEFKDGVLNVRLPKTAPAKPKSVEVKVG